MAFTIMLTKFGGVIEGVQAVNKSYPNFFEVIKELGVEVQDE
jgi:5-enolpyruvylshikimate-3-phosphate synthase